MKRAAFPPILIFLFTLVFFSPLAVGAEERPLFEGHVKAGYVTAPSADLPKLFDDYHALPIDARLAAGLAEAMKTYARLFHAKGVSPGLSASFSEKSLGSGLSQITLTVKPDKGKEKVYAFNLWAGHGNISANLTELSTVFSRFLLDHKDLYAHPSTLPKKPWPGLAGAWALAGSWEYIDIFEAVRQMEDGISPAGVDPDLFFAASDVFSMLAFMKRPAPRVEASMALAAKALSLRIIGLAFVSGGEPSGDLLGGLLLALGYRTQAAAEFGGYEDLDAHSRLLALYAANDIGGLEEAAREISTPSGRLAQYLILRARGVADDGHLRRQAAEKLAGTETRFVLAWEYALATGGVEEAHTFAGLYMQGLLETHFELMRKMFVLDWAGDRADPVRLLEKQRPENIRRYIVNAHKDLIAGTSAMKGGGKLFTLEFMKDLLREDMYNLLYIQFDIELLRFGLTSSAKETLSMTEEAYPGSGIVWKMRMELDVNSGRASHTLDYLGHEDSGKADPLTAKSLLRALYYWYRREPGDDFGHTRYIHGLLGSLRRNAPPDTGGLLEIAECYYQFKYWPVAERYTLEALAMDRHDPRPLIMAVKLGLDLNNLPQVAGAQDNYGLVIALGERSFNKKDFKTAAEYFAKAVALQPKTGKGYQRLGVAYKEMKLPDKAVSAWGKYLKHDSESLEAVNIQTLMAWALMEHGRYKEALKFTDSAKESGHMGAMFQHAEVLAALGKPAEAREWYSTAMDRYPGYGVETYMAVFLLDQGDRAGAVKMFKSAKRQEHDYRRYFPELIKYYKKKGDPAKAVEIVKLVEKEDNHNYAMLNLARALTKEELHPAAAAVYMQLLQARYKCGCEFEYFEALQKSGVSPQDAVSRIEGMRDKSESISFLCLRLLENGYFDVSLPLLLEYGASIGNYHDETYAAAAMAWHAGGREPKRKEMVLAVVEPDKSRMSPWGLSFVQFLLGDITEKQISAMVKTADQACQLNSALGLKSAREGDMRMAVKRMMIAHDSIFTSSSFDPACRISLFWLRKNMK